MACDIIHVAFNCFQLLAHGGKLLQGECSLHVIYGNAQGPGLFFDACLRPRADSLSPSLRLCVQKEVPYNWAHAAFVEPRQPDEAGYPLAV